MDTRQIYQFTNLYAREEKLKYPPPITVASYHSALVFIFIRGTFSYARLMKITNRFISNDIVAN
jgi:hypothetical protein